MRLLLPFGAAILALARPAWADTPASEDVQPRAPEPHTPADTRATPTQIIGLDRFAGAQNEEVILQLRFDAAVIGDGVSGEVWAEGVRLPLGQLASMLEFPVAVDPTTGRASGWFIREGRRFDFDPVAGTGVSEGHDIRAPPGAVRVANGETMVDVATLAVWFPLDFEVSLETMGVEIRARETLPMQARRARERARARLFERFGIEESGVAAPRQATPYDFLSSPFLGVRLDTDWSEADGSRSGFDISASADVAWMTGRINVSGDSDLAPRDTRVSLGREDPYGELPLGMTGFEVGDTFTPTAPLISRGLGGRGISASTAPTQRADQFDRTIVRGQLPAGYEVELYRNGVLFRSQASRGDGLYEFLEVPLAYGENELRLVFYGPAGQTYQEVRRLRVGDDFLRPGDVQWQFGAAEQEIRVVPPEQPLSLNDGDGGWRAVARADVGVLQTMTLSGTASVIPLSETESVVIGGVGARLGLGRMTLRADAAAGEGGAAFGAGAVGRALGLNFGLDHVSFEEGFQSDLTLSEGGDLQALSNVRLSTSVGIGRFILPLDLDVQRKEHFSGDDQIEGAFRATAPLPGGMLLSNSLNYQQFGQDESLRGTLDLNAHWRDWLVRGAYSYVNDDVGLHGSSYGIQADRRFGERSSLRLGYSAQVDGGDTFSGGLTWRLRNVALGLGASHDTEDGATRAQASLSFGLGRDHEARRWVMSPDDLSETGVVRAAVYIDRNANGVRDGDDEALSDVQVGAVSGRPGRTGEDGLILLTNLEPGRPATVSLDAASLPDPYLLPAVEAIEIAPRRGRIQVLDFPVVQTGAVEGATFFSDDQGQRTVGNVQLELVSAQGEVVAATASEFDGFYAFERVRPGTYSVRVAPTRAAELGVGAPLISVSIDADGAVRRGIDLVLQRGGAPQTLLAAAMPATPAPQAPLWSPTESAPTADLWLPEPAASEPLPALITAQSLAASSREPIFVAALSPLAPLASAPPRAAAIQSSRVAGRVVYVAGQTDLGLAQMRLHVRNNEGAIVAAAHTGADGVFEMSGLRPGVYSVAPDNLELAARGLIGDGAIRFEVRAGASEAVRVGDITLHDAGAPAPLLLVEQMETPGYQPPAPIEVSQLSEQPALALRGRYVQPTLAPTRATLQAPANPPELAPLAPAASDVAVRGQLLLGAGGSGFGLPGVRVEALAHGVSVAAAMTSEGGGFELRGLPAGAYELRFDRLALASRGAHVAAGASFEIEVGDQPVEMTPIVLTPFLATRREIAELSGQTRPSAPVLQQAAVERGAVAGQILASMGGADYPLSALRLHLLDDNNSVVATVTTGADGSFVAEDLAPGRYTLAPDRMALAARTLRLQPAAFQVDAAAGRGAVQLGALIARSF